MNLPVVPYGVTNLSGLIEWLRTLAASIAVGWGQEHNSDGTHGVITATSLSTTGAVSAGGAITANGQIVFPATQNSSTGANTLDDYEEGLITPLTPINISFSSSALAYQKIGSWVHCSGFAVFPATADGNSAGFTNLPYTCENSTQSRGGCIPNVDTSGTGCAAKVLNNSTAVQFIDPATATGLTNAQLTGATLHFDFKYRAAS